MTGLARRSASVLRLEEVSVGYGDKTVVAGLSVELGAGEWLSIIGPNGAGKSTVLKAIVGVIPFGGQLSFGIAEPDGSGGRPLRAASAPARHIGYVPQNPVLPPGMTTAEYALLGRTAHMGWFGSESAADRRRVSEVLERLGLSALASRPIDELSGGEAQRATLARALVQEASILVLDEPTSALDLAHQIGVLELVDQLRRERDLAVVTAMHDLSIASRFSDRLLLLSNGSVAACGTAGEVLTEEILSRQYRTPVNVMEGPDGGVVVVPLRTSQPETSG